MYVYIPLAGWGHRPRRQPQKARKEKEEKGGRARKRGGDVAVSHAPTAMGHQPKQGRGAPHTHPQERGRKRRRGEGQESGVGTWQCRTHPLPWATNPGRDVEHRTRTPRKGGEGEGEQGRKKSLDPQVIYV